ncbi:unnamed protein product [Gadus morhua 'NCC']
MTGVNASGPRATRLQGEVSNTPGPKGTGLPTGLLATTTTDPGLRPTDRSTRLPTDRPTRLPADRPTRLLADRPTRLLAVMPTHLLTGRCRGLPSATRLKRVGLLAALPGPRAPPPDPGEHSHR